MSILLWGYLWQWFPPAGAYAVFYTTETSQIVQAIKSVKENIEDCTEMKYGTKVQTKYLWRKQ